MDANGIHSGNPVILSARNIHKHFGKLHVLKGVDIDIPRGEVVSIVGPSGAGKTTLLQILGTLLLPDNNHYKLSINGLELNQLSGNKLSDFRNRHIGFIFQFHYLLPELTALENTALPAYIAGVSKKEADRKAETWLRKVGLAERLHHLPAQLSGGEQQRVAVARALVNNPDIVFADEPSGNLDTANAAKLHRLFFDLQEQTGTTFVIVTHNPELAGMSHRIYHMQDGKITDNK